MTEKNSSPVGDPAEIASISDPVGKSRAISIMESVALLKDAIDRANTPDGSHPFLFDTLSLHNAKRILGAWADAGLVDGPRGYVLPPIERRFVYFFNFLGWWHWSIGVHLDVRHPHVDLHLPFGFVRLGWTRSPTIDRPRTFGYDGALRQLKGGPR